MDTIIQYSTLLSVDGIDRACTELIARNPSASMLTIRILIDIVRNQGDSPANVAERVTGLRSSSSVDGCINRLVEAGFIALVDSDTPPARKNIWITHTGAAALGLKR